LYFIETPLEYDNAKEQEPNARPIFIAELITFIK
jgi:hypothetical protein